MVIGHARAQQPAAPATSTDPLTEIKVIERVNASLDRSLEYIASQQRQDGSWFDNQAPNALAILAFLGRGHVPGRGPYKEVLERGKKYLLGSQREDGLIVSKVPSTGPMYEHALATLALAEMYGMDPDPKLEMGLRKAVDLIVRAQSPSGGWRYQPIPGDQDLSVTIMQIVALRAANNAEVSVPNETINKAITYVRASAVPTGGFAYTIGGAASPQMTAAGTLALQLLGQYNDPTIAPALETMTQYPVEWQCGTVIYFYYFHYYAVQASYQAGGKYWNAWHPRIRELLLAKQNADGSWDAPPGSTYEANAGLVGPNRIYQTAMASLVLEIYMHFLPAYQR